MSAAQELSQLLALRMRTDKRLLELALILDPDRADRHYLPASRLCQAAPGGVLLFKGGRHAS